jgi:ribose transport system permease protein
MNSSVVSASEKSLLHRSRDDVTTQVLVMSFLLLALIVFTGTWDRNFLSSFTLRSISRDTAIWSLFAIGQAVVIIAGGIDLSVGSLMCFTGVVTVILLSKGISLPLVFAIIFLMAQGIGAVHGMLVSLVGLQPFLVTLCSLLVFRGLARVLTHDQTVSFDPTQHAMYRELGAGTFAGVPTPVWILMAVLVPLSLFLRYTVPGRYMYAIGSNLEAARYSGIRINWLRTCSYMFCSTMAAIAAILETADVGSVSPSSSGLAYEMYGITGAVLGGCSLSGGRGSLIGVVIGMAILRVIKSTVIFLNISTYWTFALTGFVLLIAVIADSTLRRRRSYH